MHDCHDCYYNNYVIVLMAEKMESGIGEKLGEHRSAETIPSLDDTGGNHISFVACGRVTTVFSAQRFYSSMWLAS